MLTSLANTQAPCSVRFDLIVQMASFISEKHSTIMQIQQAEHLATFSKSVSPKRRNTKKAAPVEQNEEDFHHHQDGRRHLSADQNHVR